MRLALIAPLAGVIAGCAATPPAQPEQRTVDVTVTYRERILLPPGHTLKVTLDDVSLADAPSRTLAEATVDLEGRGPPYAVQLSTPALDLDPRHEYAVRAEIRDPAGALRFTTDTRHSVLTRGAPDRVDIVLVGVSAP
ncbi:MAG: YbaY family lipoprotein [Brevundimonas sp.]|uniref:YbaY family lipoprotein n=1 Tax=Brevundimonas sp. TaxID=1871086 RepID=UPI003918F75B